MDLLDFVKYVEDNKLIQDEIKNCKNCKQFNFLLKKYNCEKLFDEMKSRSGDLAAAYWPWAEKLRADRKKFFDIDIDQKL